MQAYAKLDDPKLEEQLQRHCESPNLTARMAAKAYRIHQYAQGHYEDWHTLFIASCAIIFLCGRQQIEIISGEKMMFSLGDLLYQYAG